MTVQTTATVRPTHSSGSQSSTTDGPPTGGSGFSLGG